MADKKHPDNDASAAGVPDDGTAAAGAAAADAASASEPDSAVADGTADGIEEDELTVQDILDAAEREVAEPTSEHLADLKRVTAEYANYRRRTEANRAIEKERVTGDIVKVLIPVLDDIYRAEKHGDLVPDSAFATIAAKLRSSVERLGLTSFGTVGEPFDPTMHEAIFQQPSAAVDVETVGDVAETGYYLGSTLLRAAKVVVQVPSDG
ncbi:nucleotide exchange factor GrpE [Cryobacterium sp. TMS1-20-1]|uniref:Protein GrpE n=1 Tax=Cryobacterium levicorallinum TaxID=995038 RepID=A0A1I2XSJ1_9MICO|nr:MULTISPECIES: nucleotide exchange factor GrpE [Cryobacterium]TFB84966.1 nucleotide exchange factor GrpE [Cryobacterium levicorallinum]TFC74000.1 nucleotide exchange factor GrpE [Cryobacterium sp. TMS1-20-1]TFD58102.1 nucleotide exchange factor GrpE [Cryobacterium sp. Hh7]TFD62337.1 nucleotide exchange factor GrpE [Cryobacterium sp. Hh38]SFH16410.1 molecular chaperone GrpE [Cryobacterium levicorallinum]